MEKDKKVVELKLDDILPNRFQPRIKFDEKALNELSGSIREYGVIQPILVRKIGDKYEIIAGERRYKASVMAGKTTVPAIINNLSDEESAEVALIENIQRKDLTPIEEAVSYKKILDMGYLNQESLAKKLDRNQSTISNKLRLLNLDDEVQEALLENKISERHARSLLRLENAEQQKEILNKIVNERLTVRKTDDEINSILNIISNDNSIEETNMNNNEQSNIFNIPTDPIIEEIEIFDDVFDPILPILSVESEDIPTNITNPGFLDIERIEEEATDIIVDKPLADIERLLELGDIEPDLTKVIEEPEEDIEPQGKFFNIIPEISEVELSIDDYEPITEIEETTNDLNLNMFNFNASESIMDNVETVSEINNPVYGINEAYDNVLDLNIVDFDIDIDDNIDINDSVVNTNLMEETMVTTIPDYNFDFINDEVEKIISNHEEITVTSIEDSNNFKDVINIIRECSSKIERMGYYIDTEEIDFEDTYQVVFKINKE